MTGEKQNSTISVELKRLSKGGLDRLLTFVGSWVPEHAWNSHAATRTIVIFEPRCGCETRQKKLGPDVDPAKVSFCTF